jgi:hypothetical protein
LSSSLARDSKIERDLQKEVPQHYDINVPTKTHAKMSSSLWGTMSVGSQLKCGMER